ncbi:MAG: acyl-CoA dehydrogenase family protein [Pseudomonadota bacterium]
MQSANQSDLKILPGTEPRLVGPVLPTIETHAAHADETRSIHRDVISALKSNDIMRAAATREIGGIEASITAIGEELSAVAQACANTAWCLWNHLSVFHLFVGTLGPEHAHSLRQLVEKHAWVSFPAGAGSGVHGRALRNNPTFALNGRAAWGSGTRYADWTGVVFAVVDDQGDLIRPLDLRFSIVPTNSEGLTIDPTWDGASLRASATDDIHYEDVVVDAAQCARWFGANRAESLREVPVIHPRYREDWVGLSDIWLGWMGVGLVGRALENACSGIANRRAIMGNKMVERPTIQLNIGRAGALFEAARGTMVQIADEVDERISAAAVPDTADYLRQMATTSMALNQLDEAMQLLARTQGGASLREQSAFERRARDFRAFPLHINAHQDRVTHQLGRHLLSLPLEPF